MSDHWIIPKASLSFVTIDLIIALLEGPDTCPSGCEGWCHQHVEQNICDDEQLSFLETQFWYKTRGVIHSLRVEWNMYFCHCLLRTFPPLINSYHKGGEKTNLINRYIIQDKSSFINLLK